jgi:hypothetical protein
VRGLPDLTGDDRGEVAVGAPQEGPNGYRVRKRLCIRRFLRRLLHALSHLPKTAVIWVPFRFQTHDDELPTF